MPASPALNNALLTVEPYAGEAPKEGGAHIADLDITAREFAQALQERTGAELLVDLLKARPALVNVILGAHRTCRARRDLRLVQGRILCAECGAEAEDAVQRAREYMAGEGAALIERMAAWNQQSTAAHKARTQD